jgi:hypothetical protein
LQVFDQFLHLEHFNLLVELFGCFSLRTHVYVCG